MWSSNNEKFHNCSRTPENSQWQQNLSRIKDTTSFNSKFKECLWRSRTSVNLTIDDSHGNRQNSWRIPRHRCRSRQSFGAAKDFCSNFPEKYSKENMTSKTKNDCISCWANFFKSKRHFAQIFSELARKELNKSMTSKKNKTSALWFWVSFIWNQSTYSDLAKVFTHLAKISIAFARIFTKSKVLGVGLHSRLLHQCTTYTS